MAPMKLRKLHLPQELRRKPPLWKRALQLLVRRDSRAQLLQRNTLVTREAPSLLFLPRKDSNDGEYLQSTSMNGVD